MAYAYFGDASRLFVHYAHMSIAILLWPIHVSLFYTTYNVVRVLLLNIFQQATASAATASAIQHAYMRMNDVQTRLSLWAERAGCWFDSTTGCWGADSTLLANIRSVSVASVTLLAIPYYTVSPRYQSVSRATGVYGYRAQNGTRLFGCVEQISYTPFWIRDRKICCSHRKSCVFVRVYVHLGRVVGDEPPSQIRRKRSLNSVYRWRSSLGKRIECECGADTISTRSYQENWENRHEWCFKYMLIHRCILSTEIRNYYIGRGCPSERRRVVQHTLDKYSFARSCDVHGME